MNLGFLGATDENFTKSDAGMSAGEVRPGPAEDSNYAAAMKNLENAGDKVDA
jgi:hypothetical protein